MQVSKTEKDTEKQKWKRLTAPKYYALFFLTLLKFTNRGWHPINSMGNRSWSMKGWRPKASIQTRRSAETSDEHNCAWSLLTCTQIPMEEQQLSAPSCGFFTINMWDRILKHPGLWPLLQTHRNAAQGVINVEMFSAQPILITTGTFHLLFN